MSVNYKSDDWDAAQFRIYATVKTQEIEREIDNVDAKIKVAASRVFRDESISDRLIAEADQAGQQGYQPRLTKRILEEAPERIGRLQGSFVQSGQREQVRHEAKRLAVHLEGRNDLRITLGRYEELYRRAAEAERFSPESQRQAMPLLQDERTYCDVTRETRALEYRERLEVIGERQEPTTPDPDTSSRAKSEASNRPPTPTQGDGSEQDWWERPGREKSGAQSRREPELAHAGDDWWRDDTADRDIEADHDRERDR